MTGELARTLAAVDLGSNSFHMIVAEVDEDGRYQVVDRMREMVRLADGFDERNYLSTTAVSRAMACLERFGERLSDIEFDNVRVVGTNTLRKARNAFYFINQAELALGHAIDVISGHEEARLIYLGVSHGLQDDSPTRLVMDIGGGSTEFILGAQFEPRFTESLHMGCVSLSQRFFADGKISETALGQAQLFARQELEPLEAWHRNIGWEQVIGASGTILAIHEIVMRQGWSKEGITASALEEVRSTLLQAGNVEALQLDGLSGERRPVFVGGFAILYATFEALKIDQMLVSSSALREGLLYDLLGRINKEDARETTIAFLADRYQLDLAQASRVNDCAQMLLAQIASQWHLDDDENRALLRWAAMLHEIGLSVSHSQYHKHGGYLLRNLDMPGFARGEQARLASLVRGHRRKVPLSEFEKFPVLQAERMKRLAVILRLAFVLNRRRRDVALPPVDFQVDGSSLKLRYPEGWLDQHPLTTADLEQEAVYLKAAGTKLKFK
ncbi:MAG: exopolyphosphatase [Pseudomonadota bacterium]